MFCVYCLRTKSRCDNSFRAWGISLLSGAMCSAQDVIDFRVAQRPQKCWGSDARNLTIGEQYECRYDVELILRTGAVVRDVAQFWMRGSGRNCFLLETTSMCLKICSGAQHSVNEREWQRLRTVYPLLPDHLPFCVGQHHAHILGARGSPLLTDMLLVEFVGQTLQSCCLELSDLTDDLYSLTLKFWLCDIVDMTVKAFAAGLVWHYDFTATQITWNERTCRWCFIYLGVEQEKTPLPTFEECWTFAVKRFLRARDHLGRAGTILKELLVEHLCHQSEPISGDRLREKLHILA